MTSNETAWLGEFGIDTQESANFLGSKGDLDLRDTPTPYAHSIKRAFDLLDLNGVLVGPTSPLVYFKVLPSVEPTRLTKLHRLFWNHGGAPILVVIFPKDVHVYSGLERPTRTSDATGSPDGLITTIDRASTALREFLPTVASGEFFRQNLKYFKPAERVDRSLLDNLQTTRNNLAAIPETNTSIATLDAFLCRLVFTCYLFDRQVIGERYLRDLGLRELSHLRDILALRPRSSAKDTLYSLFGKLAIDFNGDLFDDDLEAEAKFISTAHVEAVDAFFQGTDVASGQQSFWPYDFEAIPIETISAIYERFLKSSDRRTGAFYTPRFLAELVLDVGLCHHASLKGLRFLDPACGSGIFLVGLFNRLAEEWSRANPNARNERRASELMQLLRSSVFGIDSNPTACRIAAFSLYLAYLDQLEPCDIQILQERGGALPRLINQLDDSGTSKCDAVIWCGDFFETSVSYPTSIDVVIGNPPWGSIVKEGSAAARWLQQRQLAVPDGQIAAAFMWKATEHTTSNGRICFVLPHGILFNHSHSAVSFQKSFIQKHALDRVLNLTDYQFFLFSEARHPALVLSFRKERPSKNHSTEYWVPKTDWKVLRAEIIEVATQDRNTLPLDSILGDLESEDAPQIWKRMAWATPRDRRLLDRLSDLPRLRDRVRQTHERDSSKSWLIAEGFQPLGKNDDESRATRLQLPSNLFISAKSPQLQLFLLKEDCERRRPYELVRARSNKVVDIFNAPHVLVTKGFGSIAFVDFAVSFRHALRGIRGPVRDRKLLMFLAAYLRSPLARYFQFHTSSNWGVTRQEVHVRELLRLPFPLPDDTGASVDRNDIIDEVVRIMRGAMRRARKSLADRSQLVNGIQENLNRLVYEYFDVVSSERLLIEDTVHIGFDSFRPSMSRRSIPAIEPSTPHDRSRYIDRLCSTLNGWAKSGKSQVTGRTTVSNEMGVGLVTLQKSLKGTSTATPSKPEALLAALDKLRKSATHVTNTFELAWGIKVFDGPYLYLVKPLKCKYWTETAALNDADEIAGSILMQAPEW